jgi:ATP-dependent DNA helicase RecG
MPLSLPGVGPKTQEKLSHLGIDSPRDLLYHIPHRYLDFSHSVPIAQAQVNQTITITGQVLSFQNVYTRFHKNIQKARVGDSTGTIDLVWFNQPYLGQTIKTGDTLSFAGTVSLFNRQQTIIAPEYGPYNTGKIVPIYPETKGLTSKWFRKTIQTHLTSLIKPIIDPLPPDLLSKYNLTPLPQALTELHLPQNSATLNAARTRLGLDEILNLQAHSSLQKQQWQIHRPRFPLVISPNFAREISQLIQSLPFTLTPSQTKVWRQVLRDLLSPTKVTNRLIQGDVGSGKTIIIVLASYLLHLNHQQTILIAPTEILAQQHFATFSRFLQPFAVPLCLLTRHHRPSQEILQNSSIIISTHAVFAKHLSHFPRLNLVVVDEQHKFGVKQRATFTQDADPPHSLTMTATPIPRTIGLTILGNLDLSHLEAPPQSRLPIKTFLVPNPKTSDCYHWIENQIRQTHSQAFIVCPLISQSDKLTEVKAAETEFEHLQRQIFPKLKLALIHGKTDSNTREKILADFQHNRLHILVTTPIIEVGIDFPNASIMVIQSAERFGLAQLHQLRGRVGRGSLQSYCYLFTQSQNDQAQKRLEFFQNTSDGLKIAQYDLKTRGPGEIFSFLQHGHPSLNLASLNDYHLINTAQQLLSDLLSIDPTYDLTQLTQTNFQITSDIAPN